MMTLKHICRELDLDPYKARTQLRAKFGKRKRGQWKWPNAEDPDYVEKRDYLHSLSSSTSPKK